MLRRALQHRTRSARCLLAAWLCVLLTTVAAPFAQAQLPAGWEPLCSATGSAFRVPGPAAADEAVPQAHGLDCALCLPMLAPPPARQIDAGLRPQTAVLPERGQGLLQAFISTLPPVRAPPL